MTAPLPAELMENALLAKLRDEDRQHLAPHMMRIDMGAFDVLQRRARMSSNLVSLRVRPGRV